jgi:hypothetical protein
MDATRLKFISELVDEIALEKPLDFESFNYDSVKEVAIMGALDVYNETINNSEMGQDDAELSMVATMAYLILENTILWITITKDRENEKRT